MVADDRDATSTSGLPNDDAISLDMMGNDDVTG
jgi:hypothetical protein